MYFSSPLVDHVAQKVGVPTIPSYVPPMPMESHDTMTFYKRTKSFLGHVLTYLFWDRIIVNPEVELFRELVDPAFPHLNDLAKKCPLVMVNSNELYELPRPTLAKVINIGGLGIQLQQSKPLPEEIENIIARGEGAVVFSFGSLTPARRMPESWKEAFFKAFKRFPHIQFFVKYDGDDVNEMLSKNVHLMNWLPQMDLLYHPKTKAFITHAGYNSVQEAIHAGVPMICLALFGDQPKNAKVTEKLGISVNLKKTAISEEAVVAALQEVLNNERYRLKALKFFFINNRFGF
ncbi:UDP-glucoronosyl and UDP-glucosyl transferase [Oesophagostomum dentatum]|uniref:UDP-glucuronosyltransferase n=1 Tax=Oesophagostomum dentatum TaxID=61180 RepID=A0A0B1TKL3_OESDE|nr:UDP-glucoronosyl and UDP-glucosyl transferase [Oesophagostomum dentatum]